MPPHRRRQNRQGPSIRRHCQSRRRQAPTDLELRHELRQVRVGHATSTHELLMDELRQPPMTSTKSVDRSGDPVAGTHFQHLLHCIPVRAGPKRSGVRGNLVAGSPTSQRSRWKRKLPRRRRLAPNAPRPRGSQQGTSRPRTRRCSTIGSKGLLLEGHAHFGLFLHPRQLGRIEELVDSASLVHQVAVLLLDPEGKTAAGNHEPTLVVGEVDTHDVSVGGGRKPCRTTDLHQKDSLLP
mmetsp:Transcript_59908/g.195620  ORF Transcript_59908/g.195620 Transcript_59908/m.195620 type:complete len:238 (-) Transcript_59908:356-1069(-)